MKKNNGPVILFEFRDTESSGEIDMSLRSVLSIEQNQQYNLSYPEKNTDKTVYISTSGQHLADHVMIGLEMLDVLVEPSTSPVPGNFTRHFSSVVLILC
jgi:hypothetical protein